MSNIDHMLASIIGKDKEAFSSAFADEMRERLATSIIDKNLNISQDLLTDEEEMDSEEQDAVLESVGLNEAPTYDVNVHKYEVDHPDDAKRLPKKMKVKVPKDVHRDGKEHIEDYISNHISDTTGFLHHGFSYDKVKKESVELDEALRRPPRPSWDEIATRVAKRSAKEKPESDKSKQKRWDKAGLNLHNISDKSPNYVHRNNLKFDPNTGKLEESGVVKKGKPIPMDLLYPKDHPRAGEIIGGKKKAKEESEKNMENLKDHVEPLEELRGAKFFPSGYTFKTTKDAKEFAVALKHMGVKKNNISIKGKTISVNLVGGRHHDTLVMIKNLAKDMKASINEGNVIGAIREAHLSENGVIYTLKDAENIHILPEDAESIIQIHDKLNGDNQTVLRDMLSETEESYYKVLNFCNKKT